jgi:hypothetical protein
LDELLRWKSANQDAMTEFLHQHRELSGIHYMTDEAGSAYVEFSLKSEMDTTELEQDVRDALGSVSFRFEVIDPDRKFQVE